MYGSCNCFVSIPFEIGTGFGGLLGSLYLESYISLNSSSDYAGPSLINKEYAKCSFLTKYKINFY